MPPVGGLFAAVGGAFAAASTGVAGLLGSTALTTGFGGLAFKAFTQLAGGLILGAVSRALAPKPKAMASGTRVSMSFGETNPASFILGVAGTPGELLYHNSWDEGTNDTPNEFYVQVIELSDLPARMDRVWINGEWATLKPADGIGVLGGQQPVEGYEDGGRDRLWVRFYDGTQTAADPYLVDVFGDDPDRPWTSEMVGLGMAYAIVTARTSTKANRQKPECKFELSAWGHYDRRKDSTAGGIGAQRWGNWRTWKPSRNPIALIDNILRGIHDPITGELIWGGQGVTNFNIPAGGEFAAMNACDAVRTTSKGTEPEYRAGIEVLVSDEPADVIDELLKACVGQIAEMAGQWHFKVGPPGPAVYDFTDDDVILTSPDTFKPIRPLDALYNGVSGQYVDPAAGWQPKDAPLRVSEAYVMEDGGKRNIAGITYPAVPFPDQVQRLMAMALKDERRQRTHSLPMTPECVALGPLDDVSYTSVENGYIVKKFSLEMVEDLPDGNVAIACRERDPSDYDYGLLDELPTALGYRATPPRPRQLVDFSVEPWTITDAAGRPRTPGIRLNWTVRAGVTGIRYMVRNEATGQLVQTEGRSANKPAAVTSGSLIANGQPVTANGAPVSYTLITDVAAGFAIISGAAIKNATLYGVNAMYEPVEGRDWSGWLTVTTPDVRLLLDDFADEVTQVIEDAQEAADVAAEQAQQALTKANEVEALVGGISEELISDIADITDALAGISTGDIQEIRGIGMAGLRKGGWAVDPTLSEWTAGGASTPAHYTTLGFGTYATRQASATNAPFPTSALISVPSGGNGPVSLYCMSSQAGHTAGADPKAGYVVLEALFRMVSGDPADCRLRLEWRNATTGAWVSGNAFGSTPSPGRFVQDWGFAVDPNRVQSKVVVWQRPVTADAVRIALIVKAVGQTNATEFRIDYLNFGPATEAEIEAMTAKGYADAAINQFSIELESPTGALAALGSTLRTEFGDADAEISDTVVALTNDVESMAGAVTVLETQFGGTNLVKNPQFSDGVQASGVAPRNWDDWDAGMLVQQKTAPGVGAAALQNAPTKYVAVVPADTDTHHLRAHKPVPIRAGERIEASAQFAAGGSSINKSVRVWVRYYDTDGGTLSDALPASIVLNSAAWRTFSAPVFTAPAGAASFSLYVQVVSGGSSSAVYFTNVSSRIVDNASYASAQTALAAASNAQQSVATWQTSVEAHFDDMDAMVSATATAYATSNMAASTYVVRFLNGAFKLVGWNDTTGSGSAIVLDADNVIAPGTFSTGSLVVTDLGYNKVPDDQLQSSVAWSRNDTGWELRKVATAAAARSVGEVRWTKALWGGTVNPVRYFSASFAVRPGQRLDCSYQGAPNGTGRLRGWVNIQFLDREGNFVSLPNPGGVIDTTSSALPLISGRVVVPSGAYQARWVWTIDPVATTTPVARFFAPLVIENADASVLITPDGAFINELKTFTAWIEQANIANAAVGSAQIANVIQSTNFSAGSSGWRIQKSGSAEFNDITVRRNLVVASGVYDLHEIDEFQIIVSLAGLLAQEANLLVPIRTSIPITAWGGTDASYICSIAFTGTVTATVGGPTNRYWGWAGEVVPLTRWDGADNRLWVMARFFGRNVAALQPNGSGVFRLNWQVYKVS